MIGHLRRLADAMERSEDDPPIAVRLVAAVPEGNASFSYTGPVRASAAYSVIGLLELLKQELVLDLLNMATNNQQGGVYYPSGVPSKDDE
jgi:hypothetical protein